MWPTTEQNAGWDALQHLRQGNLRCAHVCDDWLQHLAAVCCSITCMHISAQGRPRRPSLDQRLVPVRRRGPLAVVVCSTDGCLQPWKVFDLEETDIVEVRVDGGVVSDAALASILMAVEVQGARLVLNLANDRDAVCRMAVEEAVQSGTYLMRTDGGENRPLGSATPGGASKELSVLARCRTSSEATGQQHPLLGLIENIQPAVRYVAERRYGELQARRANVAANTPLLQCDQHTLHDVCKVCAGRNVWGRMYVDMWGCNMHVCPSQAHAAFGADTIKSQLLKWLSPDVAAELCVTSGMLECDKALVHFHH